MKIRVIADRNKITFEAYTHTGDLLDVLLSVGVGQNSTLQPLSIIEFQTNVQAIQ